MADFSLEDLVEPIASASKNFAVKVGAGALKFGCILYREFPAAIVGEVPNPFARGLMDTLCNDREPLPPPPIVDYPIGKCDNELYDMTIQFNTRFPDDNVVQIITRVWGKVGNFVRFSNDGSTAQIFWECRGKLPPYSSPDLYGSQIVYAQSQYRIKESDPGIRLISLVRVNGQPDNCGDPSIRYPPSTIPEDRKTGTITNIYNDGTDFILPIIYAPVTGSVPITFDVAGIKFNFDFGGLTINDGGNVDLASILNRLDKIDGDITDLLHDIDILNKDVEKIQQDVDKPPPKTDSEDYDEDIKEESDDKEESNIENLAYVKIDLLTIPKNAKTQSGNDAPTIYYAGWFEFRTGEYLYPREYIHFQSSIFEAPSGADGYAYTLYKGYAGRAIVVKQKPPV